MKTTIKKQDGSMVAILEGRLDTASSSEVEQDLSPLMECSGQDIILDCTLLTYISSSGLRIFLNILKSGKAKGSKVFVKGLNADLRNIFTITGFIKLFDFK